MGQFVREDLGECVEPDLQVGILLSKLFDFVGSEWCSDIVRFSSVTQA